jgi:cytochrome c oxidase cbb3-type subunit 3
MTRVPRILVVAIALLAMSGCERERRDFNQPPSAAKVAGSVRLSDLVPGGSPAGAVQSNPLEENAFAVAEGKRMFHWMNCNGCHSEGGGGMGPALMDDVWIYGSEPANIVATILQGRPNGMPSFAGRLNDEQVWQLAAYVRSMSGQLRKDVATSRNDDINSRPAENRTEKAEPRNAALPAASERP